MSAAAVTTSRHTRALPSYFLNTCSHKLASVVHVEYFLLESLSNQSEIQYIDQGLLISALTWTLGVDSVAMPSSQWQMQLQSHNSLSSEYSHFSVLKAEPEFTTDHESPLYKSPIWSLCLTSWPLQHYHVQLQKRHLPWKVDAFMESLKNPPHSSACYSSASLMHPFVHSGHCFRMFPSAPVSLQQLLAWIALVLSQSLLFHCLQENSYLVSSTTLIDLAVTGRARPWMSRQFITGPYMSIYGFSTLMASALKMFRHLRLLSEHQCIACIGLELRSPSQPRSSLN